MSNEIKTIHVAPDSELARLLSEVAGIPVLLEKDGELYRLNRVELAKSDDLFANYDPQAAIAGIQTAAGSWKDVDVEAFKTYVHARRRTSSRPTVHL